MKGRCFGVEYSTIEVPNGNVVCTCTNHHNVETFCRTEIRLKHRHKIKCGPVWMSYQTPTGKFSQSSFKKKILMESYDMMEHFLSFLSSAFFLAFSSF